eukprot:g14222.t1
MDFCICSLTDLTHSLGLFIACNRGPAIPPKAAQPEKKKPPAQGIVIENSGRRRLTPNPKRKAKGQKNKAGFAVAAQRYELGSQEATTQPQESDGITIMVEDEDDQTSAPDSADTASGSDNRRAGDTVIGRGRVSLIYNVDQSLRWYAPFVIVPEIWFMAAPPQSLFISMWSSELWRAWLKYNDKKYSCKTDTPNDFSSVRVRENTNNPNGDAGRTGLGGEDKGWGACSTRQQFFLYKQFVRQYQSGDNYYGFVRYRDAVKDGKLGGDMEQYMNAYLAVSLLLELNGVRNGFDDKYFQLYHSKTDRTKLRWNLVMVFDENATGNQLLRGRDFFYAFLSSFWEYGAPLVTAFLRWPDVIGYPYFTAANYYPRLQKLYKLTKNPRMKRDQMR